MSDVCMYQCMYVQDYLSTTFSVIAFFFNTEDDLIVSIKLYFAVFVYLFYALLL